MSRACQWIFCLAAVMAALTAPAQTNVLSPVAMLSARTNVILPLPPVRQSPVDFFRQLLMMSPADRLQTLADRTPDSRARILKKVHEYLNLDADERELRLRATELRWYLVPLMRTAPVDRSTQLTHVPSELLPLVQSRLAQWDLTPPDLQREFLTNDPALHYFAQPGAIAAATNAPPDTIAEQFNRFFDFQPAEQQQLLRSLSGAERGQMEKTLKAFGQLPPQQRVQCIRNYARFVGMGAAERAEFLKNAGNWSRLSPQERQSWRDLVAQVPVWPPAPSPPLPRPPHLTPKSPKSSVATNEN
jgi:hypothetical protein